MNCYRECWRAVKPANAGFFEGERAEELAPGAYHSDDAALGGRPRGDKEAP
jgi:hypothetical protein